MSVYQHGQVGKLKLVIWDLDETFWNGTIDDGDIPEIPESRIELIKALTDRGIVNSICSKNDKDKVKAILTERGLWDLFVFPSIDWSAKGNRIKGMLEEVGLRAVNTLFIDDNHLNIEEVEFCVPGILTANPNTIEDLLKEVCNSNLKLDLTHKRLNQYKVLEEKIEEKSTYGSAKEFLLSCNIKLDVHKNCLDEEPRIYELIHRSNQLNFTKVRSSENELKSLLASSEYQCGTVWVSDRFGDYGMVGFFAIRNGRAEHFLFSCRTIGMGVEQYVYQVLGCPQITIVGDVVAELGSKEPLEWINANISNEVETDKGRVSSVNTKQRILLIGGCDLEQTAYYLEQSGIAFDRRFNYVANKRFECHPDSTINLRASIEYSDEGKNYILDHCIFNDKDVFYPNLITGDYDVVIYSPLIDYSNGLYESKEHKGLYAVYGNKDFPEISTEGYLSEEEQKIFEKKFIFRGGVSPEMLNDNLEWIINKLPKKTIVFFLNGAELEFQHPYEPNRHLNHIQMNKVLVAVAERHKNVKIIDVASMIHSLSDYSDSIRHYNRKIYYQIANAILVELRNMGAIEQFVEIDESALGFRGFIRRLKQRKAEGRLRDDVHAEAKKILRKIGLLNIAYKVYGLIKNGKT